MEKKGLISLIIIIFLAAGVSGGFVGYFFPRLDFGSFNVTVDGRFSEDEGWQYSSWIFTEYLITDENSLDAYNYYYIHLKDGNLYVLVDFVSDITDNSTGEWFSIWIDTDNSLTLFPTDGSWNFEISSSQPGEELLCYIPDTETINDSLYIGPNMYTTTLNDTEATIEHGFYPSIYGSIAHRIFEIKIDVIYLKGLNTTNFNIGFLGYGTLFIPIYITSQFWGAPTIFASDYYDNSGWIREETFFKCGTGTGIYDL
ncbi:MAG: hypothetical protein EU516_00310 [Promethearchaeota archaeon]|nr:MAG: hypothetical protein EU516_00310 [Candidatus Lokiarchaeota archaeon]